MMRIKKNLMDDAFRKIIIVKKQFTLRIINKNAKI